MKLLFSADWHIKLNTKNIPNAWAVNRYRMLFDKLNAIHCDINIIGGDIFDKLPNMEEFALFCEYIVKVKYPTIIISGNHEATTKHGTFFTYLKPVLNSLNPLVQVVDDYYSIESLGIDFIPYNKLKEFAKDGHSFNGSVLVTHVRGNIPPHVKAEVDLDIFKRWDVVLAGDLHSYENSQGNILYPGSPISTSFHRNPVDTGVILFTTSDLSHKFIKLGLPQLIRKTIKSGDSWEETPYDHTIYEIEGNMLELSNLEDNELIGKKIVKRETDTALILEPEMTLAEEVAEYLRYILQIDESSIEAILQELNDAGHSL